MMTRFSRGDDMNKHYTFIINGYEVHATYTRQLIEGCLVPFLRQVHHRYEQTKQRQLIYLAAPCGAGKSTLAALIEQLPNEYENLAPIQALGMDGFHYPQSYILTHTVMLDGIEWPMSQVKGCPETFDFEKLHHHIIQVKEHDLIWPLYNRKLHDVQEQGIQVFAPILLIEGNYLMLDEAPWRQLMQYCDASIFVEAEEQEIRTRLIQRKMLGGMLPHQAAAFCEKSDLPNARRILAHHFEADITLRLQGQELMFQAKK